jgi:hypothetical protein
VDDYRIQYIKQCLNGDVSLHGTDTESKRNLSKLKRYCQILYNDGVVESYAVRPSTKNNFRIRVKFWTPKKVKPDNSFKTITLKQEPADRNPYYVARQIVHDRILCGGEHDRIGYGEQMASWRNWL